MLFIAETTQIIDPTKALSCKTCPLHYDCSFYHTICSLNANGVYFGAKLLCMLLRANRICTDIFNKHCKMPSDNAMTISSETFELFMPAINNCLKAFYKYDAENCPDWSKSFIIKKLAGILARWDCLDNFDFMFSQDIRATAEELSNRQNSNDQGDKI